MRGRFVDFTGERFGRLLVEARVGQRGRGDSVTPLWRARCDCGRSHLVTSQGLRNNTKSCGCVGVTDIASHRFGRVVAIELVGKSEARGEAMWSCRCDCGTTFVANGCALRRGHTRSCGCLRRDSARERMQRIQTERREAALVNNEPRRAA